MSEDASRLDRVSASDRAGADTTALYRRYERPLRAWLGWRLSNASQALVEDACASAWLILVAKRPVCGERIYGWLRTTALHEAYRLLRQQGREQASELGEEQPAYVPARRDDPETALEAKRALRALASLRERERRYMAWQVGGYRYSEMQELADGATYTPIISGCAVVDVGGCLGRSSMTCRQRSRAIRCGRRRGARRGGRRW
ncbi:MAG: RNA polymerase sigma factor [Thermoleophilaceae bacterium]